VKRNFVSAGMCADVCVHDTGGGNPHVHIMLTTRPIESNGSWGAKSKKEYILDENGERTKLPSGEYKSRKVNSVDWNEQSRAEEWRGGWANIVNEYLSRHGVDERVDHRSYERQGIDKIPTVHMGVAASQMERKGIVTDKGNLNRDIKEINDINKQIQQTKARIKKQKKWLYSLPMTDMPKLIDMMNGIADGKNLNNNWQKVRNLKTRAKVFMFMQENNLTDITELADKVTNMHEELYDISKKITAAERRLNTLNEHLAHYEIYKQHKAVYMKYKQLDPKKGDAFYDKHSDEILLFENSKNYFDKLMKGNKNLPIKEWQNEQSALLDEKFDLCERFYKIKDELKNVEALKRGAENIMREDEQKDRVVKAHNNIQI